MKTFRQENRGMVPFPRLNREQPIIHVGNQGCVASFTFILLLTVNGLFALLKIEYFPSFMLFKSFSPSFLFVFTRVDRSHYVSQPCLEHLCSRGWPNLISLPLPPLPIKCWNYRLVLPHPVPVVLHVFGDTLWAELCPQFSIDTLMAEWRAVLQRGRSLPCHGSAVTTQCFQGRWAHLFQAIGGTEIVALHAVQD